MPFRHAILGLLADGPLHGYDLKTSFDRQLSPTEPLNFGQVYTALDRLHRDGCVLQSEVAQSERPDKKVYALTDTGQDELRRWLTTPSNVDLDLRNDTYLKLMIARRRSDVSPVQIIAIERQACMTRLHELNRAHIAAQAESTDVSVRLLLDLAILRLEAFAKWLDRCEAELQEPAS